MRSIIVCVVMMATLMLGERASAQPAANTVPKYDGAGNLVGSTIVDSSGNVGIGTTNPAAALQVVGAIILSSTLSGARATMTASTPSDVEASFANTSVTGYGMVISTAANDATRYALDVRGNTSTSDFTVLSNGNVGIGTTAPTAKLHVAGNVVVDGTVTARYQDVAEWVDRAEAVEAGTIMTIDPAGMNRVTASTEAYDVRVAGAVSAQPGLVLGEAGDGKALVAQSGRVRVKVDATYGAIHAGDLLVTSPTPGHAMRSEPIDLGGTPIHRPGTVLGKALESLVSGRGEILVLLTLQ